MQIILHPEATLHKLTADPSKAKNAALARAGLLWAGIALFAPSPLSADIIIDSGQGKDTVIHVDPGGSFGQESMIIDSDPDNGSLIQVSPPTSPQEDMGLEPIIIVPEIHIKE